MKVVNVRQLKNNPSEALRDACDGPVLVLKGDRPEALLLHLDIDGRTDAPDVMLALGAALFAGGAVSVGRAARIARVPVAEMVTHLSRLGINVVGGDEPDVRSDMDYLDEWLGSS